MSHRGRDFLGEGATIVLDPTLDFVVLMRREVVCRCKGDARECPTHDEEVDLADMMVWGGGLLRMKRAMQNKLI